MKNDKTGETFYLKNQYRQKRGGEMYWVHKLRKIEVEHVLEFLKKIYVDTEKSNRESEAVSKHLLT